MNITSFTENVSVISQLADNPSLAPAQLKAKFDEGSRLIQDYINKSLIPEIEKGLKDLEEKGPEVINSLSSDSDTDALSAAMGRQLDLNKQNKILVGTEEPSGGNDGDIYIQY